MPILEDEPRALLPEVAVRPSAALELEWVLHSAVRPDFRRDHPSLRLLLDEDRPDLREAVATMWAGEEPEDGAPAAFTELVLLAHHAGLLFDPEAGSLLDALPEACRTVPSGAADWPLEAETERDRRTALHRLSRLRRSPATRRRFCDLVGAVWEGVAAAWEAHGRPAVDETVAAKRSMLAKGAGWRDLVGSWHFGETAERVVARLAGGGEVVVVPAYFAHLGLLYDLPGCVVLGIRAEEPGRAARARSEDLARRLRAVSDPTRLAIVEALLARPLTVSELAQRFGLAQPTVSAHVKLLRDAGIVADTRDGARRNLVVQGDAAVALVAELEGALGAREGAVGTSEGAPGAPPRGAREGRWSAVSSRAGRARLSSAASPSPP